jgi:hypothetical protein
MFHLKHCLVLHFILISLTILISLKKKPVFTHVWRDQFFNKLGPSKSMFKCLLTKWLHLLPSFLHFPTFCPFPWQYDDDTYLYHSESGQCWCLECDWCQQCSTASS